MITNRDVFDSDLKNLNISIEEFEQTDLYYVIIILLNTVFSYLKYNFKGTDLTKVNVIKILQQIEIGYTDSFDRKVEKAYKENHDHNTVKFYNIFKTFPENIQKQAIASLLTMFVMNDKFIPNKQKLHSNLRSSDYDPYA